MASQFHTPSLFDEVIFLGENMPDDSHPEPLHQQQPQQLQQQQHAQRIRGMDQGYTDYSNNVEEPYNTMEQQQLLSHHHITNTHTQMQQEPQLQQQEHLLLHHHHHPQQQQQQQPMSMPNDVSLMDNQTMAMGGLQTLAAHKQVPAAVEPSKPMKPLSPYALFFRDTVSTIKQQNPDCSFQELSRIVASMWEVLDPATKALYAKKQETALVEYFKNDALNNNDEVQQQQQHVPTPTPQYGADTLIGPSGGGVNALQSKPAVFTIPRFKTELDGSQAVSSTASTTASVTASNAGGNGDCYRTPDGQQQQQSDHVWIQDSQQNMLMNASNARPDGIVSTEQMLTEAGSVQKCTRESCTQMAIINPDWEDEYCSNECVVLHCRNVFNGWIKANMEEKRRREGKNC